MSTVLVDEHGNPLKSNNPNGVQPIRGISKFMDKVQFGEDRQALKSMWELVNEQSKGLIKPLTPAQVQDMGLDPAEYKEKMEIMHAMKRYAMEYKKKKPFATPEMVTKAVLSKFPNVRIG